MVESFEDLRCWKEARCLVNDIYELTDEGRLSRQYRLRDQLTSAAVSVMTNIAEGFARYHRGDFIRFLDIAQSSASEVKSLLYVVLDQDLSPADHVRKLQADASRTRAMTIGLLRHVKRKKESEGNSVNESGIDYNAAFQRKRELVSDFERAGCSIKLDKYSSTLTR